MVSLCGFSFSWMTVMLCVFSGPVSSVFIQIAFFVKGLLKSFVHLLFLQVFFMMSWSSLYFLDTSPV